MTVIICDYGKFAPLYGGGRDMMYTNTRRGGKIGDRKKGY